MNDTPTPVVRSRTTPAVAPRAAEADATLDVQLRLAKMLARGGPEAQALLAVDFATKRDLDLISVTQGVSFVQGRPVIDATLQRALAQRAGYQVVPVDVSDTSATVRVSKGGQVIGEATYTLEDAKLAGLTGKDNWKKNPKAMLVARATTQACRWYAPDVMTGVTAEDDDWADDPVDTLTATATVDPVPVVEDIPDAEIVVEDMDRPLSAATKGTAKAAIDRAKADGRWDDIADRIAAEGLPSFSKLTERQALRVVELCEEVAP